MLLAHFASKRPRYEITQQRTLDWLAEAHAEAEPLDATARRAFADRIARVLGRCGCPPDKLATRGVSVPDVLCGDFAHEVEVYDLRRDPHGSGTGLRTRVFERIVDAYFVEAYEHDATPPDEIVHVTCTGYVSPSGGQKLVAARGWGAQTRVTHAYQMGCYAALPAVRIASGAAALGAARVDIVHTELCSLHLDPTDHAIEQLVVQSLFADGFIRYSLSPHGDAGHGLRVVAAHEVILPDFAGSMSWRVGDHGMQMTLARDVPERIGRVVRDVIVELYRRANLDGTALARSLFAVHPGGPRIIDGVSRALELAEPQVRESRRVLHDHGNMSSATLPHIWMRMLADPQVARGTLIASLAFGPGLTACALLLEKV